jgi:hypothetical protein
MNFYVLVVKNLFFFYRGYRIMWVIKSLYEKRK